MMNNYMDLKAFRKDVEKALEGVAKKYGVDISAGNIRYGTNDLSIKLDVIRNDIDVELLEFKISSGNSRFIMCRDESAAYRICSNTRLPYSLFCGTINL